LKMKTLVSACFSLFKTPICRFCQIRVLLGTLVMESWRFLGRVIKWWWSHPNKPNSSLNIWISYVNFAGWLTTGLQNGTYFGPNSCLLWWVGLDLSLSLSLTHTHTHTHIRRVQLGKIAEQAKGIPYILPWLSPD
jgi:hypothetical protein